MESAKREGVHRKRLVIIYSAIVIVIFAFSLGLQFGLSHETALRKCENIALYSYRYTCLFDLANTTGNSSICGLLPASYSNACYLSLARKTFDAVLCGKITNATYAASCFQSIALHTGNLSFCGREPAPFADACYSIFANKLANPSVCTYIKNLTSRTICSSEIFANLAFTTNNASYCNNVSNSSNTSITEAVMSNATMPSVVNVSLQLSSYLFQQGGHISAKDFCEIGVGYITNNLSLCSRVSPYLNQACLQVINSKSASQRAVNFTQALQACNFTGSYAKACIDAVLLSEAVKTGNLSICSQMNETSGYVCYEALAKVKENASICSYIANKSISSACMEDVSLNASSS